MSQGDVEKYWCRGKFRVEGDPIPNNSRIGRVRIIDTEGTIICFKTKEQVDWLLIALRDARHHAFGDPEDELQERLRKALDR